MNQQTVTKINTQSILDAEWITEEQWHTNLNEPVKAVSYGQSKSAAHGWQGKKAKWHNKSFSAIAKRHSAQADAAEAGRDEETGDLLWAV